MRSAPKPIRVTRPWSDVAAGPVGVDDDQDPSSATEDSTSGAAPATLGTTSVSVVLSGEARNPGPLTVDAGSTALDVLLKSGGITSRGNQRHIRVLRRGRQVADLDLYGLLESGRNPGAMALEPGDVIHVPHAMANVSIVGRVQNPGSYEVRPGESLRDLVALAGGLTPGAFVGLVQVVRYGSRGEREWVDVPLEGRWERAAARVRVQPLDEFHIAATPALIWNTVEVRGNARRPGRYQWKPGQTAADVIAMAGGLEPGTHLERAQIVRTLDQGVSLVTSHPGGAVSPRQILAFTLGSDSDHVTAPVATEPGDVLTVFRQEDVSPPPTVSIGGSVIRPGTYELMVGMRVSDLLFQAKGLAGTAESARAELYGRDDSGRQTVVAIDLRRARSHDRGHDRLLGPGDRVLVTPHDRRGAEVAVRPIMP